MLKHVKMINQYIIEAISLCIRPWNLMNKVSALHHRVNPGHH